MTVLGYVCFADINVQNHINNDELIEANVHIFKYLFLDIEISVYIIYIYKECR